MPTPAASTPFTTTTVATPGAWPKRVRDTPPGLRRYWLGTPGRMIELPAPKIGRDVTASSGESVHVSAGGTTSVFRRAGAPRRKFELKWDRLAGRDWQIVNGFYRRVIVGPGPWCFVPPEDVNRLDEAVSLCSDAAQWSDSNTGSATITVDDTVTSPIAPSRVIRWAGAATNDVLRARPQATGASADPASADVARAVPLLPGEPVTLTAWLWVAGAAGTTRTARLSLVNHTASTTTLGDARTDVTLTTVPQRVTVTAAAGSFDPAGRWLVPTVTARQAGGDILVAAPQLEYSAAATDWSLGEGVPRVVWTDPPGRQLDARLRSATTMTLAE